VFRDLDPGPALGPILLIPELWPEYLALASIPTSAALICWAYLPGGGGGSRVAERFE
jgi:hypothetical protein